MWLSLFYVRISIQRTYLSHFPHMFQCKRRHKQHIRETKRRLKERFNEHCWSVDKPTKISKPTTVSEHFLTDHHTANDISLIPLELVHSNRDSVRKAWEAYLITRDNTLQPLGSNKRDEMKHLLFPYMFFLKAFFYFILLSPLYHFQISSYKSNSVSSHSICTISHSKFFKSYLNCNILYNFPKATVCNTLMKEGSAFRHII